MNIELTELEIGFIKQGLFNLVTNKWFMGDDLNAFDRKYKEIKPIVDKLNKSQEERIELC